MRFRETFSFTFAYQARQAWPWACFMALLGLTWLIGGQMQGHAALRQGYLFNSPYVVANVTQIASLLWLPMVAVLTGSVAARDFQSRMFPLSCATPIPRTDYLAGHFLAAFALNALLALAITLALLLCLPVPWLQPVLGPFRPEAYLAAYLLIALPNAFVMTALAFALVVLRRKAAAAWSALGLVLFLGLFGSQFIARYLQLWNLATLLDPLALTAVLKSTVAWSAAEKSTRLVGLDGLTLANRAIWLAIAACALVFAHGRFRFAQAESGGRDRGATPRADRFPIVPALPQPVSVDFGAATRVRQIVALATDAFRLAATGWPGIALFVLVALYVLALPELMEHVGVPMYPTTAALADVMVHSEAFFVMVLPLVLMLAAGELAWRDRDAGIAAIADATPVPDWVRFCGRLCGLLVLVLALQALRMLVAMGVQAALGFGVFEPLLYLKILFGLQATDYALLVVLALALHALVDHRYLGQLLVIAVFLGIATAPALGIDDRLLAYGTDPGWSYSDLRGFANALVPWAWFKAYWSGWAVLLSLLAILLLPRGAAAGLRQRIGGMRLRLSRPLQALGTLGVAAIALAGGVIFYNTHLLHPFVDGDEAMARRARYERLYGRYAGAPRPATTDIRLRVDLRPEDGTATVAGTYRLVNLSKAPIATLHVATSSAVETRRLALDRPARQVIADDAFGHHAFALARPLQPGESMVLRFELAFGGNGFSQHGIDPAIAANGSYVNQYQWLPQIGYQAAREIGNPGERRALGLPARPEVPLLDDPAVPLDRARAQRVSVDTVISTAPGQTAIAPGLLRRAWIENGRPHFRYATEEPVRDDLAFYSSRYTVLRDRWRDVAIEVFHDPAHGWNAQRIVQAAKASLEGMSRDFGPYPLRHLRFTERPGDGGLHAAPGEVAFQEGFARLHPEADPRDIDFAFGVVAHEVAHQWWGDQLTPAAVEGAPLLSESLAWYSSLMVLRDTFGEAHMRRVLDAMREYYLTPRSRAGVPLLRAVDWDEAYRQGPFAMYALSEYVGRERVNAALRELLRKHAGGKLPLATSRDLYRELEAVTPGDLRRLLHDLLAANTYWELKAARASATRLADGKWKVALDVDARKVTVDEAGVETAVPMRDLVEIGVYGAAAGGTEGAVLHRGLHPIHGGRQRITVVVDGTPSRAGIDPRHLLLDVVPGDNLVRVCSSGAACTSP